ncbi:exopolysaccharide biosynthesis polyprenyl glycosylphosphotransferase [Bacillus niacini]|uniref:Exopolysaccharide biosynthesis polyprenyl glycosylphosphotransferase n=1 Tax=Neobacillus niacini TaxID=86668 RepID=A0A852TD25_9BACI|nr:exopolysaccharide biosynthesis polyprenyl glycosylphosphotransferase [Neobacillus niacini]
MEHKRQFDFFQEYAVSETYIQYLYKEEKRHFYHLTKRLFDIIFSFLGLLITLPVILVFAIIIRIDSPGQAFFLQERVGLNGSYFRIIKLRSMRIDAEKGGAQWAQKNDPRVTNIGWFIRKTRIDELPQLVNVLKGDMSLIGPRPERPVFTAQFNEEIPGFVERLRVKPGITGWAQVNGGYDITPKEKLDLDMEYLNNLSFILDLLIIIKTVKVCLTGNGAR